MPDYIEFTVVFTASPEETDALETYIIKYMQPEANRVKLRGDGEAGQSHLNPERVQTPL